VVLSQSHPDGRRDNDRTDLLDDLRRPSARLSAEHIVSSGREMRAVLLGGGHRQQYDCVPPCEIDEIRCLQSVPEQFSHRLALASVAWLFDLFCARPASDSSGVFSLGFGPVTPAALAFL
jgi:hypothetical protein